MKRYTCVLYKITLNFFSFFPWGQNNDRRDYSLVLREKIFNSQKPQGAEELFVMANEAKMLLPNESPLFTVESIMNLIFQTVMRSCYKPGKMLGGNERRPKGTEGRRIRKARGTKFREEKETRDETKYHVTRSMWTVAYWSRKTEVKVKCRAKWKGYSAVTTLKIQTTADLYSLDGTQFSWRTKVSFSRKKLGLKL